ncbi:Lsr2 family protein [Arthrobacter methylotrophus]|uniref:Lsr2 family protein n=1 Tax=Arthrobacter methylotrophus TaxID=121291 RepID=A0ABV5UNZ6_9MICC
MAQKTVVELIDDLDGSTANQTLTFSLDGVDYEIDLNENHAENLRSGLGGFLEKARRTGGRKRGMAESRGAGPSAKDVRAWAQKQGLQVNGRGRIQASIIDQYLAAN